MRRNFSAEGWDEVVFSYEGRSPSRSHVKTQKHVARRGGLGRPLRLIPAVAGGALIALAILNFYYAPKVMFNRNTLSGCHVNFNYSV